MGIAGIGEGEKRARFRVAMAEQEKFLRPILRQDTQVGLHVAGRNPGRMVPEQSAADGTTSFTRVGIVPRAVLDHVC
jgi:hypothetical protein